MSEERLRAMLDGGENWAGGSLHAADPIAWRSMIHPFNLPGPEVCEILAEVKDLLAAWVFGGSSGRLFVLNGSIRLGMEAAIANLTEPGDDVLVVSNGVWGEYPAEIAERWGANVRRLRLPIRTPIDPAEVAAQIRPNTRAVTVNHVETESGIVNPLERIAAAIRDKGDAFLIVDTALSAGALSLLPDDWGVDVMYTGSHKILAAPGSFAFVLVGEQAWRWITRRHGRFSSWYLDLQQWQSYYEEPEILGRVPGFTLAVSSLFAVKAHLDWMAAHGSPDEVYEMYATVGRAIRRGILGMGLDITPDRSPLAGYASADEFCAPTMTAVRYPTGVDAEVFASEIYDRYRLGFDCVWDGETAGQVFRIGSIARHQFTPHRVLGMLASVGMCMVSIGAELDIAGGLTAADRELRVT